MKVLKNARNEKKKSNLEGYFLSISLFFFSFYYYYISWGGVGRGENLIDIIDKKEEIETKIPLSISTTVLS